MQRTYLVVLVDQVEVVLVTQEAVVLHETRHAVLRRHEGHDLDERLTVSLVLEVTCVQSQQDLPDNTLKQHHVTTRKAESRDNTLKQSRDNTLKQSHVTTRKTKSRDKTQSRIT